MNKMSTARSSGSVRLMAYESLDPEEKEYHRIMYEKCLTDQELEHISNAYEAVYPNNRIIHNSRFCKEFKTLVINGVEYISEKSRFQRSPIFAHWPSLTRNIDTTGDAPYQIGNVLSFFRHMVTLENETGAKSVTTLLAHVMKNTPSAVFFIVPLSCVGHFSMP